MAENTDVVVIGGGYAGVMAANRLTQRDDVTVTRIDAAGRKAGPASGGTVGYDYLIYTVGSGSLCVPGAAEFAHRVATLEAARRLRSVLDTTPATAPVTVVAAGPTGIETAAEPAETGRRVTTVCGGDPQRRAPR